MLKGLTYLAVDENFWQRLFGFSFELFRKGVTVPLTDTLSFFFRLFRQDPRVQGLLGGGLGFGSCFGSSAG